MILHHKEGDFPSHPHVLSGFLCTVAILKSLGTVSFSEIFQTTLDNIIWSLQPTKHPGNSFVKLVYYRYCKKFNLYMWCESYVSAKFSVSSCKRNGFALQILYVSVWDMQNYIYVWEAGPKQAVLVANPYTVVLPHISLAAWVTGSCTVPSTICPFLFMRLRLGPYNPGNTRRVWFFLFFYSRCMKCFIGN